MFTHLSPVRDEEQGKAKSTQGTIMAAVRALISFGNKSEVLPRNVRALVELPYFVPDPF